MQALGGKLLCPWVRTRSATRFDVYSQRKDLKDAKDLQQIAEGAVQQYFTKFAGGLQSLLQDMDR